MTPGLVDGHTHFGMWALNRRRVHLAGCRTREEAVTRVAAGGLEGGWVLGQGWDANGWKARPERGVLDVVHPGPVFLESLDVHAAWVNSAALRVAGIDRHTPDPYGGVIVRDPSGEPTGLLLERAVELMSPHLPVPPQARLLKAIRDAQSLAHQLGVTGIHDVEGLDALRAFETLRQEGALKLRVLFHPPVAELPRLIEQEWRSGEGDPWITKGGIKLFLDGSLGSRTAWMLKPFEGTSDRGMPITTLEVARAAIQTAAGAGISSTIHAIGDAAVRRALDLLEEAPRVGIPHRIEHFQCVHPDDLVRAGQAGIPVSMQPAHLLTDIPLIDRHWGVRGFGAYHFKTIAEAGNTVVFGSDVPVASIDPRDGIRAALDRDSADGSARMWRRNERITLGHALSAYTRGPAFAGGVLHRRGTVVPGMDADLVAWEVDPAAERGGEGAGAVFASGRCVLTVVAGEVVHSA
ncbi:MAG: amidohydrolase family protein [Gemmatimonadota bacterium]